MEDSLKLNILSPERKLLAQHVVSEVRMPGSEGEIQILPGHATMLGTLHTGIFSYSKDQGPVTQGFVSSGFFEIAENEVTILAETLELKSEIDYDRARRAQQKAEDMLREASLEGNQFKKYELKLQRALIRQQLSARGE